MYDFKNPILNKILLALACFVAFVITTMIIPGVIGTIFFIAFIWAITGLTGWSMGRMSNSIEDTEGVPFYKEPKFYEHVVRGPITLIKYFK